LLEIPASRKSKMKMPRIIVCSSVLFLLVIVLSVLHVLLFTISDSPFGIGGRRGRNRRVVGFTTTCAISAHHHWSCEFEPRSWQCVLNTTLCDIVCQWLAAGRWFSPDTPVSSTNKTDRHDIAEILLKVALDTINQTKPLA